MRSEKRSSSTNLRAACTFSDSVLITMPSVTGKVQAGWRLRCFSISTRHMRQEPWGCNAGWLQSTGISMSLAVAACRTVCPACVSIWRPLIVIFRQAIGSSASSLLCDVLRLNFLKLGPSNAHDIHPFEVAAQAAFGFLAHCGLVEPKLNFAEVAASLGYRQFWRFGTARVGVVVQIGQLHDVRASRFVARLDHLAGL